MLNYVMLFLYIAIAVGGSTFMKLGNSFTLSGANGKILFSTSAISMLGFILYFCSFIMWTKLVTKFNLSYIVPITGGISNLALVVIGLLLFHERISVPQAAGVVAILIGIVLISVKN